jgi:hypothetical protein
MSVKPVYPTIGPPHVFSGEQGYFTRQANTSAEEEARRRAEAAKAQGQQNDQTNQDLGSKAYKLGKHGYESYMSSLPPEGATQAYGQGMGMFPVQGATPAIPEATASYGPNYAAGTESLFGPSVAPASTPTAGAGGGSMAGMSGIAAMLAAMAAGGSELDSQWNDQGGMYDQLNKHTDLSVGGKRVGFRGGDWAKGLNPMAWVRDPKESATALFNGMTLGLFD